MRDTACTVNCQYILGGRAPSTKWPLPTRRKAIDSKPVRRHSVLMSAKWLVGMVAETRPDRLSRDGVTRRQQPQARDREAGRRLH